LADDPVGLAGDAVFAEIGADVSTRDAIREVAWAPEVLSEVLPGVSSLAVAETVSPQVLEALSPLSVSEQRALDAAVTEQTFAARDMPGQAAPEAMEADSMFSAIAAELAIDDAVVAAGTPPAPDPSMVAGGGARPSASGPGMWQVDDLVRAEAEIAFEDVAYDVAYNAVDSLVTVRPLCWPPSIRRLHQGPTPKKPWRWPSRRRKKSTPARLA